jgi:hypothetical protein
MSNLLGAYTPQAGSQVESIHRDVRDDIRRMLAIVEEVGSMAPEMKKTRTDALRQSLENIQW